MVKFCHVSACARRPTAWSSHLVLQHRVDAQHVKGIALRLLAAKFPLLLLRTGQIRRRVDVAGLPLAVYLALELAAPLRLNHLARLRRGVEAGLAGEARSKGGAGGALLVGRRFAGGAAAAEDAEEGVIWRAFSETRRGVAAALAAYPASGARSRSIAGTCCLRRRRGGAGVVAKTCWRPWVCWRVGDRCQCLSRDFA
jgi:hypothetical protein